MVSAFSGETWPGQTVSLYVMSTNGIRQKCIDYVDGSGFYHCGYDGQHLQIYAQVASARFTLCQVGIYQESNLLAANPSPVTATSQQVTHTVSASYGGSASVDIDQLLVPHPVKYSQFNGEHISTGMVGGTAVADQDTYIEFDFTRAYTFSRFVIEGIRDLTTDCQIVDSGVSIDYCNSKNGREYSIEIGTENSGIYTWTSCIS